jgi:Fe-S-cluster containining protein
LERFYLREDLPCPLLREEKCLLARYRPLSCRLYGLNGKVGGLPEAEAILASLSRSVFLALSGALPDESLFRPCFADVVSGRFIQTYFHYLGSLSSKR